MIKPRGRGRGFLSPFVGPIPLLGLTPNGIMGPLQLSDHVVLNRQTGEQLTNWDMLNKTNKFEFSLFGMSQCAICAPVW